MADDWFSANGIQTATPAPVVSSPPAAPADDWFAANGIQTTPKADFTTETTVSDGVIDNSPSALELAGEVAKGLGQNLNPYPLLKSMFEEGQRSGVPAIALLRGLKDSEVAQFDKAKAAWKEGRVSEALGHTLAMAVPILGPMAADAAEKIGTGDPAQIAHGAGELLALGVPKIVKAGIETVKPAIAIPPILANKNPVEAAAVDFGHARNIPIDAATATGSKAVAHGQKMAAANIGGAYVAEPFKASQTDALARVGRDLAADANSPGANALGTKMHTPPVTVEQAGTQVRTAITTKIQDLHATASTAYTKLRKIENTVALTPVRQKIPMTDAAGVTKPEAVNMRIPMAVDVRTAKGPLQPIFDALMREREMAPLMGGKGRAAVALKTLLEGPDFQKLSVVDAALGDLKALSRGADLPELRTEGQGIAAEAVKHLDKQVRLAALRAGPDALRALDEGRAATKAKYVAAEVLDQLHDEPVQTAKALMAPSDANLQRLRAVVKEAPDVAPDLGRAWLEDRLSLATEKGLFDHADRLYADWQKLGGETKRIVFKDPVTVHALNDFFLLAKKIQEMPNTSGTAYALNATKLMAAAPNYVLAKALYSPKTVRLLTKGLRMSISGTPPARAAAAGVISRALGEVQAVPMAAEDQERTPTPVGQR